MAGATVHFHGKTLWLPGYRSGCRPGRVPLSGFACQHQQGGRDTAASRFEKLTQARLADVDIVAGADICFWDELTPVLYNLIRRSLRAGVKQIIIADPGRSPFYALAENAKPAS